jgi:phenylalanine-4-hydroxylase
MKLMKNKFLSFSIKSFKNYSKRVAKSYPQMRFFEVDDKTGLVFSLKDKPGVLVDALKIFSRYNVNLTYINSKPSRISKNPQKEIEIIVDFEGRVQDQNVQDALKELKQMSESVNLFKLEEVPWFQKGLNDLDMIGRTVLSGGQALYSDHPGFNDDTYKKRREEIVNTSNSYYMEDNLNIPEVNYTEEENQLWTYMWDKLIHLHQLYACEEFRECFAQFEKECDFKRDRIPQIKNISAFLKKKTNTIFRPVGGLLTQREFLNGLAFRVFHSTQYIRHKSKPLYTPEPDIIHETMGHAPLFANQEFADFSQLIGIASLAASDEDIIKLATLYWFTIEFGVCMQNNKKKVYGAGILSSPGEIEWCMSDKPKFLPFDIWKISNVQYEITKVQDPYFLAPSFLEMKNEVIKFADSIKKPFNLTYNLENHTIEIDRSIATRKESLAPIGDKLF